MFTSKITGVIGADSTVNEVVKLPVYLDKDTVFTVQSVQFGLTPNQPLTYTTAGQGVARFAIFLNDGLGAGTYIEQVVQSQIAFDESFILSSYSAFKLNGYRTDFKDFEYSQDRGVTLCVESFGIVDEMPFYFELLGTLRKANEADLAQLSFGAMFV